MNIITYAIGSGGNMVAALVDDQDYVFDKWHFEVADSSPRAAWKKGLPEWNDASDYDLMDKHLATIKNLALASHFSAYHINRKHEFIFIDSPSIEEAAWCAIRKKIYSPEEIMEQCDVVRPHATHIIRLEDILNGKLISVLQQLIHTPLNEELYQAWIKANV